MRLSDSVAVAGRDLSVVFDETVAIDRSTFEIPSATITAVIGPNGSGKSTLLNTIAGLVEPSGGVIEVAAGARPNRIAYVLQTTRVNETLPVSVRDVVTMGRYGSRGLRGRIDRHDREAVDRAMERTGVTDLASTHIHNLSGGQRQRVFVAQGLAQDHDLLLLDEPLTGLDLPSAQSIDDVIHDERDRGGTVVMTTHDLSEARVADHVILMGGRVVASGSPEEVLTPERLAEAYGDSFLHFESGTMLLDDPAHIPVEGRHVHRER